MPERTLRHPEGGTVTERYIKEEPGKCGYCQAEIAKVHGSSITFRRDGVRYSEHPGNDVGCAFRCIHCRNVIDENWRPLLSLVGSS